ncbi:MAG: SCP2 sterol-binding domain-containing protein [Candidatus Freyarchaeota archaeon]
MEELKRAVEQSLEWSDEEFREKMPSLMAKIRGKVGKLIDVMPDLPQKLTKRLEETDAKKNAIEAPQASEAFTELLWAVISELVEKKPELKKVVEDAGNIKVNYEATDSLMKGHYELKSGKITGGPGLSETQDLKVIGPSDVLIKLTTGAIDSQRGFLQGLFKLEGNLGTATKLTPVTKKIAETLKGK